MGARLLANRMQDIVRQWNWHEHGGLPRHDTAIVHPDEKEIDYDELFGYIHTPSEKEWGIRPWWDEHGFPDPDGGDPLPSTLPPPAPISNRDKTKKKKLSGVKLRKRGY